MIYLILFALLGFCVCSDEGTDYKLSAKYNEGVEDYKAFEEEDDIKYNSNSKKDRDWGIDDYRYRDPNVVGLEKDDREDIVRPCALDDWQCIRIFFAKNSYCKAMYGPVPDPMYFERNTIYFVFANLTTVLNGLEVRGLASSKISEFYVNRYTGNLVFALNFKDLNETIPNVFFRYKRTAKESRVLNDFTTILIGSGTLTAVIPKVPNLRLDLAEIHADLDNALPPFLVGPKAFTSTDPEVLSSFARLVSDIPTALQEAALFQAQLFMGVYIQKNICDFGLKFISI